jgi:hypothetical protein
MQTQSPSSPVERGFLDFGRALQRRLFPRLRLPLIFAVFSKNGSRRVIGPALYKQSCEVDNMPGPARQVLVKGQAAARGVAGAGGIGS